MKWVLRILGVLPLLVAALSLTASTAIADDDNDDDDQLVVDGRFTLVTPDPSPRLDKGEHGYAEGDVSEERQLGVSSLIGEFKESFVSTEDGAPGASIGQTVWRISDEGDIWVARVFDTRRTPEFEGAIIGGTEEFAGASGEYSATIVDCCPLVIRATFTFDD